MASLVDNMIDALEARRPNPADAGTVPTLYKTLDGFDSLSDADKLRVGPHMFRVMARGWDADLGSLGPMVHAIETLPLPAYREVLVESVRRRPMYLNLWMIGRVLHATDAENERAALLNLLREVRDDPKWADVSDLAAEFLEQ